MKTRAESAAQTEKNILKALGQLWLKHSIRDITLEMVAEKAGTTVRTILRKYGSREGLSEAAIGQDVAGIESIKESAKVGDIKLAVEVLMKEYEATGAAAVRTLAVENDLPVVAKILKHARQTHKKWCARIFEPYLPKPQDKNYELMLGVFYAATDVNKWKLLRIDLGYSKEETGKIFYRTLKALTKIKTT